MNGGTWIRAIPLRRAARTSASVGVALVTRQGRSRAASWPPWPVRRRDPGALVPPAAHPQLTAAITFTSMKTPGLNSSVTPTAVQVGWFGSASFFATMKASMCSCMSMW